ncbi:VOC family protein [Streptomyces sp. NRRL F-5126]|uniref:VOC family protein n=1 Tax=Streptomyces sp. NRRL F-5126 TaxID=1463857 RepID=UPI0018FEF7C7|nr:VOC family protein [Streptomyces sp. NRRL F-5126]
MSGMADGPGICPTLLYDDAKSAIRTLKEAFGFTEIAAYEGEDGKVLHAELAFGPGVVMLGSKGRAGAFASVMADAGPSSCYVVVDGGPAALDAHYARAAAAGVEILMEPTDQDYGSRDYMARDAEGNVWSFGTYAPALGGAG